MQRRQFLRAATSVGLAASVLRLDAGEPLKSALTIRRNEPDRFAIDFAPAESSSLRILQITDTHFGSQNVGARINDRRSFLEIRCLVEEQRPDFLVHTGDFINNDQGEGVSLEAIEVFDDLGIPWTHALGNHDIGHRSVEELRKPMKHAWVGEFRAGDKNEYAFRFDITSRGGGDPQYTLFCFDSGFKEPNRRVSQHQIDWFVAQMKRDAADGLNTPCLAMIHIPVVEFESLRVADMHKGHFGERVCFDNDTGDTFTALKNSGRVRGVFSGTTTKTTTPAAGSGSNSFTVVSVAGRDMVIWSAAEG